MNKGRRSNWRSKKKEADNNLVIKILRGPTWTIWLCQVKKQSRSGARDNFDRSRLIKWGGSANELRRPTETDEVGDDGWTNC